MASTPSDEEVTSKQGGTLSEQFKRHSEQKRLAIPELNANGQRAIERAKKLDLGVDPVLLGKLTAHLLQDLSKNGDIPDMVTKGRVKTLPEGLQFGFASFLSVHSSLFNDEGKLTYVDDFLAYRATMFDTNCETFDFREMYFKPIGQLLPQAVLNPPVSFTRVKNATGAPDEAYINRLWELFDEYPIVGMNVSRQVNRLLQLTKTVCGEDQARFCKDGLNRPGRLIDTKQMLNRLEPSLMSATMAGLSMGLNLTPPGSDLASYAQLEAELFNRLLEAGYTKGVFSDFATLVRYMHNPILLPKCPMGRYKGRSWRDVPRSMVSFYLKQEWVLDHEYRDLRYTLNHIEEAIALEASQSV